MQVVEYTLQLKDKNILAYPSNRYAKYAKVCKS